MSPDSQEDGTLAMLNGCQKCLSVADIAIPKMEDYFRNNSTQPAWDSKKDIWLFTIHHIIEQKRNLEAILHIGQSFGGQCLLIARSMLEGASQLCFLKRSDNQIETAKQWTNFPTAPGAMYWHGSRPTRLIEQFEAHITDIPEEMEGLLGGYFSALSGFHHWDRVNNVDESGTWQISLTFAFLCMRYTLKVANDFFPLALEDQIRLLA